MFKLFKRKVNQFQPPIKKRVWYKRPISWVLIAVGLLIVIASSAGWISVSAFNKISSAKDKSFSLVPFADRTFKLTGENKDRVNILLLGMGGSEHPGGQLSDTNILFSYQPSTGKTAMVSIPRDLYVKIPGVGYNKLNYANAVGGPELAVQTLEPILDQKIPYFVQVDFTAFKDIVNQVGGISVDVPQPVSDPYYPAPNMIDYQPFYLSAGKQNLNGDVALKYVRSRETTSDFDRSARQQMVIMAIKDKALSAGVLTSPKKILGIVSTLTKHLRINFSPKEVERLLALVKNIDSSKVQSYVLDNSTNGFLVADTSLGGYYLRPKSNNYEQIQEYVDGIFSDEAESPQETATPATVTVLNGTDRPGLAASFAKKLQSSGYTIVDIDNSTKKVETSEIYNWAGSTRAKDATKIKNLLGSAKIIGDKTKEPDETAEITIIVGDDYQT